MITTANLLISNPVAKLVKWSLDWGFSKTSKRKECIAKYRRIYGWLHNLIYFGNGQAFHLLGEWRNCFFSYFCAKSIEIKTFSFAIYKRFPLPTHLVQLFHPGQTIKLRIDTIAFISVVRTNPTLAQWFFSPRASRIDSVLLQPHRLSVREREGGLAQDGQELLCARTRGEIAFVFSTFFSMRPQRWKQPSMSKGKVVTQSPFLAPRSLPRRKMTVMQHVASWLRHVASKEVLPLPTSCGAQCKWGRKMFHWFSFSGGRKRNEAALWLRWSRAVGRHPQPRASMDAAVFSHFSQIPRGRTIQFWWGDKGLNCPW